MTNAQAQSVIHDLVAAGYMAEAIIDGVGNWTVKAWSATSVNCGTIQTFAANHSVVATASEATFS